MRLSRAGARGLVPLHAHRQDRSFPRRAGELETVEHRNRLTEAIDPRELVGGIDVLPLEEEAHEVGWADRLDLCAQAIQRVAMDARKECPVAPLECSGDTRMRVSPREAPAK